MIKSRFSTSGFFASRCKNVGRSLDRRAFLWYNESVALGQKEKKHGTYI